VQPVDEPVEPVVLVRIAEVEDVPGIDFDPADRGAFRLELPERRRGFRPLGGRRQPGVEKEQACGKAQRGLEVS
jgi:hypothetical protein